MEDEPEFNVAQDPAAAVTVLETGLPTTVYPVDLFETVVVPRDLVARLQTRQNLRVASPASCSKSGAATCSVTRAHWYS